MTRAGLTISKAFSVAVVLALTAVLPSHCSSDRQSNPLLEPIKLLRDDTDKKIRSISIPEIPKNRPEKTFKPQSKLSLDDTLAIVDTHYPKLLQGHIERNKAAARTLEAKGAFDPFYRHISEYKRIQDITFAGVAKDAVHNEGQLELPTRSGVRLFGRLRINPNDASTPFLQSGFAGEYTAGAIIPLMRGLGINKDRAVEQKARLAEPLASVNLNLSRMNVLFEASVAYWNWYVADRKVKVVEGLLKIGEAREALVRGRVADGDLPALAITEAEKEVRRRRGDLYKTQRELAKSAFKLSLFLWGTDTKPPALDSKSLPQTQMAVRAFDLNEIEKGTNRALRVRPEFAAIALKKEMVKVDLKLAKNEFLPQVNLLYRQGADTGRNGIGVVIGGGVQMMVPLRQRRARGLIKQAELELEKLSVEEEFLKRRITIEVQDTGSELNAAYNRLIQARQELDKARAVETGERQRFDLGDSSLFIVNRRERDRAEAEKKGIETYGEYLKALAAFKTVTGDL